VKWPGVTTTPPPRVDIALHYHFDFAATTIELLGGTVPPVWDGRSFAEAFRKGRQDGREFLVLSQGAWSCQRSVRFDEYLAIRSYHDGYHGFPDVMLFDLRKDPHEQRDLAASQPQLVQKATALLDRWHAEMMRTATHATTRCGRCCARAGRFTRAGTSPHTSKRLRETGREKWATLLAENTRASALPDCDTGVSPVR
jgi:arylsulfatase A-like enzyme